MLVINLVVSKEDLSELLHPAPSPVSVLLVRTFPMFFTVLLLSAAVIHFLCLLVLATTCKVVPY